jgi:type I restriction enzyme R subunit
MPAYQSEAELERQLIDNLLKLGYERVTIADEDALWLNLRGQLFKHNKDKLGGVPFTDKEFERIKIHLLGKSIFDSAKLFREPYILQREDGTQVYIEFYDKRYWCRNGFQVTNQISVISGKYANRYDVTLLINGFPVVQIELKRRGMDIKEAFNQVNRYRHQSYTKLFKYIQYYIISNGVDTKYFANSDSQVLPYAYTFFWSDEENKRITNLSSFTAEFLERCHMSKMIARYMVVSDTDKRLMIMRPYQVYAVESLIHRATETGNNGYIWHTTGSGKTLTSYKVSQIIRDSDIAKKVFFLVDRKDLDDKTYRDFEAFEKGCVDPSSSTEALIKIIKQKDKGLIVTTIQKMANAIKNPKFAAVMEPYRESKVVFIIDECHRSQFGDMHKAIKKFFKSAQYFGFTGTPRFAQFNPSQDGRSTNDIFEECLHKYLMKDAINDQNVLGFSVEYYTTFNGDVDESDDEKVSAIDKEEVYNAPERRALVAKHILDHHKQKGKDGKYTAIFAASSVPSVIAYYDLMKNNTQGIKIAAVFTYGANEDAEAQDEHSRDALERIVKDYNALYGTNYRTDTFGQYFSDLQKRIIAAQVDIVIVCNMLLAGFDSKMLNTLYLDKNLKFHDLVQAYSRTNRLETATKPYGNIVCYRNLKRATDVAIKIFSEAKNADDVLVKNMGAYLDEFHKMLEKLHELAAVPGDVDFLQAEEDKKKFIVIFRELTKILIRLKTFLDFEFAVNIQGMTEQDYEDYRSKYLLIYDQIKRTSGDKVSILQDIDFSIELMHTDKINVSYIMGLIRNINLGNIEKRDKDIEFILQQLGKADNDQLRRKADLIKAFLLQEIPNLGIDADIDDAFNVFENEEREKEVKEFAETHGVNKTILQTEIAKYEYSGILDTRELTDNLKGGLLAKMALLEQIKEFIIDHVSKFENRS